MCWQPAVAALLARLLRLAVRRSAAQFKGVRCSNPVAALNRDERSNSLKIKQPDSINTWPDCCTYHKRAVRKQSPLESKNDESRFGLTRAPFSEQRDAGVRPKPSLAVTLLRAETHWPDFKRASSLR